MNFHFISWCWLVLVVVVASSGSYGTERAGCCAVGSRGHRAAADRGDGDAARQPCQPPGHPCAISRRPAGAAAAVIRCHAARRRTGLHEAAGGCWRRASCGAQPPNTGQATGCTRGSFLRAGFHSRCSRSESCSIHGGEA